MRDAELTIRPTAPVHLLNARGLLAAGCRDFGNDVDDLFDRSEDFLQGAT
jgi:hypothetical protein